jgi:hypothetical protein
MCLFSSIALTLICSKWLNISQSQRICLPACSLSLPLVNQNWDVMAGFTNASNTAATGLRISIAVVVTGALFISMMVSFEESKNRKMMSQGIALQYYLFFAAFAAFSLARTRRSA